MNGDFIVFIYLAAYILVSSLFGYFTRKIAFDKGHDSVGYFWLGFFLELIGIIIAACLSDQRQYSNTYAQRAPDDSYFNRMERERTAEYAASMWECPYCGEKNVGKLSYCTRCRRDKNEAVKIPCPSCGAMNSETSEKCWVCQENMQGGMVQVQSVALKNKADTAANMTVSVADEIMKFKQLLDQGTISQSEFEAAKKKLLDI